MNLDSLGSAAGLDSEGSSRDRLAACLMTDAERYTGLTEAMRPSAIVELINRYFAALFGPVLANGGWISDVKGDGMLAVWTYESSGAQFKTLVCHACTQITEAVDKLNGDHPAHRLPTRLGVDFGPIALARVGAHARYEYRPVGDPVNTASRLQELNKALGTRILVSDSLVEDSGTFLFRDLGSLHLRGRRTKTRVRELVGLKERCSLLEHERCRDFAHAVAAYDLGDEREALRRFRDLQKQFPTDGPTRFYLRRIADDAKDGTTHAVNHGTPSAWLQGFWRNSGALLQRAAR